MTKAENNSRVTTGQSLYEKILDAHIVRSFPDSGDILVYIDLHLIHEVTSPQAFNGLEARKRRVRRPDLTLAVADHATPTQGQEKGIAAVEDPQARAMLQALDDNAAAHDIDLIPMGDQRNGIVHVVGPEQGRTLPGMTIVCGDSHTSTHGAFGALAHGIGTSEVEHVLATQTLRTRRMKNMRVHVANTLSADVCAKDLALHLISETGTSGGNGCVIEFTGSAITALSMEGRMTLCNMTIEAGARAGLIAPDATTFAYLRARRGMNRDTEPPDPDNWADLASDPGTDWHRTVLLDGAGVQPMVSWGTSPEQSIPISGRIPEICGLSDPVRRATAERALSYMGLQPGQKLDGLKIDRVFIGSCTNSRIEDLRAAARVAAGGKIARHVRAMVVPGSNLVRIQAEAEGLDRIFRDSGFEWRQPGCSMCLGMNPDILAPKERCAATSNRNFEGRQGRGGRTHLLSPAMAARAALAGALTAP